MSYFTDPFVPSSVYPCNQGAFTGSVGTAEDASRILDTAIMGTAYQYKIAYEATTGKKYRFKTQQERLQVMIEGSKPANCPG
jgi:hypothetical protein